MVSACLIAVISFYQHTFGNFLPWTRTLKNGVLRVKRVETVLLLGPMFWKEEADLPRQRDVLS